MGLYCYGMLRTSSIREIGFQPLPVARQFARHTEYPMLYYLAMRGPILTDRRARFYYRRHPDQDSNRRYPVKIALLLELGIVLAAPLWVWKGSRNPVLTAIAGASMTYNRLVYLAYRVFGKDRPFTMPVRPEPVDLAALSWTADG